MNRTFRLFIYAIVVLPLLALTARLVSSIFPPCGSVERIASEGKPIRAVAISFDGRIGARADEENVVVIFDVATGKEMGRLTGEANSTKRISSLRFTSGSARLLVGGQDIDLELWDWRASKIIQRFLGHSNGATAFAVFADGRRVVTGDLSGALRVWEIDGGGLLGCFAGPNAGVSSIDVAPDQGSIVVTNFDTEPVVWDLRSRKEKWRGRGHSHVGRCAVFTQDGKKVISGAWDGVILEFDAESGELLNRLTDSNRSRVLTLAAPRSATILLSTDSAATISRWDNTSATARCDVRLPHFASCLSASDDGGVVLVGAGVSAFRVEFDSR